jgi:hypothetical protein
MRPNQQSCVQLSKSGHKRGHLDVSEFIRHPPFPNYRHPRQALADSTIPRNYPDGLPFMAPVVIESRLVN